MNKSDFQKFLESMLLINTQRNGFCLPIKKGWFGGSFDKIEIRNESSYGRGVFATEDIDEGMIVTLYPQHGGVGVDKKKAFVYNKVDMPSEEKFWNYGLTMEDGANIYGAPEITHHGWIGHMLNDGMPNAVDIKNHTKEQIGEGTLNYTIKCPMYANCRLDNKNGVGYITTNKKIKCGEELLTAYGYGYWSSFSGEIQDDMVVKYLESLNDKKKHIIKNLMKHNLKILA